MFTDNPSYFSLAGGGTTSGGAATTAAPGPSHSRGLASLFRRRPDKMGVASSASVVSSSTTSTLTHHESNRSSSSTASAPSTPTEECAPMLPQTGNDCTLVPPGSSSLQASQRRGFRNLFRSVSANTDPEKTQQFLKGDPRPSDVAPPSPYLPHRSHSHSENDRCRPGRRKVLKSASELLCNDMVYCGLPREDTAGPDSEPNEEVFLGVDDARYYNLSATLPSPGSAAGGRRRHSIGTFLSKERSLSRSNVPSSPGKRTVEPMREPDTMAPPVPTEVEDAEVVEKTEAKAARVSRRRRHRSASSKGARPVITPSSADGIMEDVVFISSKESEASTLWVNYLSACFEQISRQQGRPPFKVHHVTVEETMPPGTDERINTARLQIVIVCPVLLEYVISRPGQTSNLARQLLSTRVLAMMLGVNDSHLIDDHRAALPSYALWRKFFVKDQDETFVGDFLSAAVAILGRAPPATLKNDKTMFSVLPKKVKMGQSRVIALLNDPLQPDDNVSVVVDRCGESIDVTHVRKRNPYTLQFSIPDRCLEVSMLVGVKISKNGNPLGVRQVKCESRLRELDQILRANDNPLEFMCHTLGFNAGDREQLDNWMVHAFQKNIPPHFNLLSTPAGMVPAHKNHIKRLAGPEENPTLLHFAARFGLEKLAWQLLECPGGDLACDLKNVSELTPADLAEQAGHTKLAQDLRGYMQMNEFTNMYSYLKVMSESTSTPVSGTHTPTNDQQVEYCRPRPLSDAYSVPPAARPVTVIAPEVPPPNPTPSSTPIPISANSTITTSATIEANYSIAPAPTPYIIPPAPFNASGLDLPLQGYMEMHPASLKTTGTTMPTRLGTPTLGSHLESPLELPREEAAPTPTPSTRSNTSKSREPSGPQDELLEIINDFKNNVFTISEVERLVETWQNRNDVQQSFKDKHRQLMAMREQYERIQKQMKEEMKRPTPFDRVRKFFFKGKKDSKEAGRTEPPATVVKSEGITSTLSSHRPVSSLSLHSVSSSSSSGRMSTVSGCSGTSLGDSGTHSDSEDRKLQNLNGDRGGVLSYEIPPAPRPFQGRYSPVRYGPSPTAVNNLDCRPPQPVPRPEDDVYYIAFPPSGLPIHAFEANGTAKELQTPSSPTEPPEYLDLGDVVDSPTSNSSSNVFTNFVAAPPGMCIPNEYINVSPSAATDPQVSCPLRTESSSHPGSNIANHASEIQATTRSSDVSYCSIRSSDPLDVQASAPFSKDPAVSGLGRVTEDVVQNTEEYIHSDTISDALADESDTSNWPEYVNFTVRAPPVPPRVPTKK